MVHEFRRLHRWSGSRKTVRLGIRWLLLWWLSPWDLHRFGNMEVVRKTTIKRNGRTDVSVSLDSLEREKLLLKPLFSNVVWSFNTGKIHSFRWENTRSEKLSNTYTYIYIYILP